MAEILLKRSSVAAAVPTSGNLQIGEMAMNTADGKLYGKKADGTIFEVGKEFDWHVLTSDFSTTSTTSVGVTGMDLTLAVPTFPAEYYMLIEGALLLKTATATVGVRPGFKYPQGIHNTGSSGMMRMASSSSAEIMKIQAPTATFTNLRVDATAMPNNTESWLATFQITFRITSTMSNGAMGLTLASETGGSVTMGAGSHMRIRRLYG